jgi:Hydrazine synthase alpha subunit middle domain
VVIFSGRPAGAKRNALQMLDRTGRRFTLLEDSEICLHSPMLVKSRPVPPVIPPSIDRTATTGRLLVQDIYQGLTGVKRGEVKWLRVVEETSRVSPSMMGGSPYNQTFLVSAALAFCTKNFLGIVPVTEDGSAYFEVPSGRAVYLQALDDDGRLIQSMRSFIQAAPGATRSCVGCHEDKASTPPADHRLLRVLSRPPSQLQPESWGSGPIDYPTMVQPILNRHCVSCHGGEKDIAAGLDLTGGWTEHFSISYENLVSRRERQLEATLIAGIDCMNGTAHWSCQIFPPRAHGSGAAPLAQLLLQNHGDVKLPRAERDLLMAWMDSNGLYHGTWDATASGCATRGWKPTREALIAEMRSADCMRCHGDQKGNPVLFEEDWVNLEQPELSRILRAPLAAGAEGFGLGFCRDRAVNPKQQRVRQLVSGYAHAVQPVEAFARRTYTAPDRSGPPVVSFPSTQNEHYQSMLAILREGRRLALAEPRVDMPGAKIIPGESRQLIAPSLPTRLPALSATATAQGVRLSWDRRSDLSGLTFELHRGRQPDFTPDEASRLVSLTGFDYVDPSATPSDQYYALTCIASGQRSPIVRATVSLPKESQSSDLPSPNHLNRTAGIRVPDGSLP